MTSSQPSPDHPAPPQPSLLVIQPTPFCNIDCSYCYLPSRTTKARMSLETLGQICDRILRHRDPTLPLDVAWHAGEPLTVPLGWYEAAIDLMESRSPPGLQLRHCFQTNGLLINDDWIRFFERIQAKVGLSIDGPAELHDANRRTRAGRGTFGGVIRAVRQLVAHRYPFHAITVLTERSIDDPDTLFDFYVQNGIREVGFNIEEIEGSHRTSSLTGPDVEARYQTFLRRFFELVWNSNGVLRVREFEDAIGAILSAHPIRDQQNMPFCIVSVRYDGTLSTFSPELLDAGDRRFGNFGFGHVALHDLVDVASSQLFRAVDDEIQQGVNACEQECRYFRWCGGGAPANKLFETGSFAATETMHCRLTRQAVLDEVLDGVEHRTRSLTLDREPETFAASAHKRVAGVP